MLKILREYEQDGYKITEYTKDGETVSHTIKSLISELVEEQPQEIISLEDIQMQTLLNTEYLVIMSELNSL